MQLLYIISIGVKKHTKNQFSPTKKLIYTVYTNTSINHVQKSQDLIFLSYWILKGNNCTVWTWAQTTNPVQVRQIWKSLDDYLHSVQKFSCSSRKSFHDHTVAGLTAELTASQHWAPCWLCCSCSLAYILRASFRLENLSFFHLLIWVTKVSWVVILQIKQVVKYWYLSF